MNILLVDADNKNDFPNLALMKLSAHHKAKGDSVELIKGIPTAPPLIPYDKVYISCIFYQNKNAVYDYAKQINNVEVGGSGWDYQMKLSEEIEHIMPDYSLYNNDFSMGFTSRGCTRKCEFCIVPKKEGKIRDHANVSEFHHPTHNKIILLDNNFLASPAWKRKSEYIKTHKLKVNFNQGLDIRLVTPINALYLSVVKYYNWTFKTRSLHFAFDTMKAEATIIKKTKILFDAGIRPRHLMFYILVGFDTDLKDDSKRVEIIKGIGSIPYIMRYNQSAKGELIKLARWVNRRYYQFLTFEEFDQTK